MALTTREAFRAAWGAALKLRDSLQDVYEGTGSPANPGRFSATFVDSLIAGLVAVLGGSVPSPSTFGSTDTLSITASSRVRVGAGRIVSIENTGPNSVTVTLYDDHSAAGRVVFTGAIAAGATETLNERVVLGAYLTLVGTAPAVTVTTDED